MGARPHRAGPSGEPADENGAVLHRDPADTARALAAVLGQVTTADPSRSPAGTEGVWAYTHLPRGVDDDEAAELLAVRMEDTVEAYAPGFRDLVVGRHLQRPVTCSPPTPTSGGAL